MQCENDGNRGVSVAAVSNRNAIHYNLSGMADGIRRHDLLVPDSRVAIHTAGAGGFTGMHQPVAIDAVFR